MRRPFVVGHRGAAGLEPENTLRSIGRAIDIGVDAVEVDARRCKDGTLVIMHDPAVDRTTNGRGRVCDQSLASLKGLEAGVRFAGRYRGERIPTLEEVLEQIPAPVWVDVELKKHPGPADGLEARVVEVVRPDDWELSDPFILLMDDRLDGGE